MSWSRVTHCEKTGYINFKVVSKPGTTGEEAVEPIAWAIRKNDPNNPVL